MEEVYWYTAIHSLALSMVFIFEPIYLYSIGYSIMDILWFFVQVYVWYAILVSFGAEFASRFGYKRSIFVANFFYVVYWFGLFSLKDFPHLWYMVPLLLALQKSFFWPAYDADVALNSKNRQRGREVGMLFSLVQVVFIVGPFLGGFIAHTFGFLWLFCVSAVLMLASAYPLFRSPEIYSKHDFKIKTLWKVIKERETNFFGYWGYAEDLMVMSLWPIFMFIVIPNYRDIGAISMIAGGLGTMLMLYVGQLADKTNKRRLILTSSIFYGITWIFRFLGTTVPAVLAFEVLTKGAKDVLNVPMNSLTFERAAEKDPDYAIAYSVFYEFSLSIGKIITASVGIIILSLVANEITGLFLIFAFAGILTTFYGLLR
ncbi:MAG: hypothetical protein A3K05_03510 [Candidatus Doudnabacteria bacterium RIFCSPHIGHO2_01_48_18]|nr:MAG: hypothetical protein A3K05_03510 [Candidatus Doudnabacteria bacterium RIFCSPHIGHO2_01_48_18]